MSTEGQVTPAELAKDMLVLGRRLIAMAEALLGEEGTTEEEPQFEEEPRAPQVERIVGRFGPITKETTKVTATVMGDFNRREAAERLGIKPLQAGKFLKQLIDEGVLDYKGGRYHSLIPPNLRDWIVAQHEMGESFTTEEAAKAIRKSIEEAQAELENYLSRGVITSVNGNGRYRYAPPPNTAPRARPDRAPEWKIRPCGEDSRATGEPVRVAATKRATRRQRSVAGAGGIHGAKAKDRNFEKAQAAKDARAEQNKTKAQKAPKWKSRTGKRTRPTS